MAGKKHRLRISGGNLKKIIFILVFAAFVWYFRPWFHGPLMGIYKSPIVIEFFAIFCLVYLLFFRKRGFNIRRIETLKTGELTIKNFKLGFYLLPFLLLFLVLAPVFSSLMPQLHLVNELEYMTIEKLPETKDNIRLMPYEVAYRYSKDSLQLSQYRLGTENIANVDENLSWMFPLVPDGFILEFMLKNKGVVFVDATTQKKNSRAVWKDLEVGEG
ncbi:MAG: hypothetical protein JSV92_01965, partial [archaeon]